MMPQQMRKLQQRALQMNVMNTIGEDEYESELESSIDVPPSSQPSFVYDYDDDDLLLANDNVVQGVRHDVSWRDVMREAQQQQRHDADANDLPNDYVARQSFRRRRRRRYAVLLVALLAVVLGAAIGGSRASKQDNVNAALDDSTDRLAFTSLSELHAAVDQYVSDGVDDVLRQYGANIDVWDVSQLTDLSFTFDGGRNPLFMEVDMDEIDLSRWNVSNVVRMQGMFRHCRFFTGRGLENWDVQHVVDYSYMFQNSSFDGTIGSWNVARGFSFTGMFNRAADFDQDIGGWDVSGASTIDWMFAHATTFQQDLSDWDVSHVTNMTATFMGATSFDMPLVSWNMSSVTSTVNMLRLATSFNQDLVGWNTGRVTDFSNMFREAVAFDADLSNMDTSSAIHMNYMFSDTYTTTGRGLETWNVAKVRNFDFMFRGAWQFAADLSGWDVAAAVTAPSMFHDTGAFDADLSSWNVHNLTDANYMFHNAMGFAADLCAWGPLLKANNNAVQLQGMFTESACPQTADPNISVSPVSSLCYECNVDAMSATGSNEPQGADDNANDSGNRLRR